MWCEGVPDFVLQRLGGVLLRLMFSLLEVVPAEFVTRAKIQVDQMIKFVLVKGFDIAIDPQ